ncbi:MAG: MBL fold metallo-hydrolase [Clostridiales bacterium]|nr:MBL fold metallo-hydrolase [Clostridiales bacterium]
MAFNRLDICGEWYNHEVMRYTTLRYGNTNTFFLHGDNGGILVDTDYAGTLPMFFKAIKEHGITVRDIKYVLATHYHPDHMGLISELMELGVGLLLVDTQAGSVHYPDEIFARDPRLHYKPVDESKAVVISASESKSFLNELGIDGEVILTPSHSPDSISVVQKEGVCMVGDLEPYEYLVGYQNNEALKEDWDKVLSYRPKMICYAHMNAKSISS